MLNLVIRRLLGVIPTLLIVAVLVFLFVHLLPGDPARLAAGVDAAAERLGVQIQEKSPVTQVERNGGIWSVHSSTGVFQAPWLVNTAGAWAADTVGTFRFPLVPGTPEQRDYAFRAGVNIVMYVLTGNYKADQVHVPALIQRLGR